MEIVALDRRNTDSLKWDSPTLRGTLPLWVADMEFETLPQIRQAIIARAEHGIYGYGIEPKAYREAVCGWMRRRFDWTISPEWIVPSPGNVAALKIAIQCFTDPGEAILLQRPVYYMFDRSALANGRKVVSCDLVKTSNGYRIDFAALEKRIEEAHIRVFLLCNPHNPVGRVYTQEELAEIGVICRRHNVLVVSDEVHSDFVFAGYRHIPFIKAAPEWAQHTIVLTGPNKTFNLAGLKCANVIIPNDSLRAAFSAQLDANGVASQNIFAPLACMTAYQCGDAYADSLASTVECNFRFLDGYLKDTFPQMKLFPAEGTYLAWIDVSGLGIPEEELHGFLMERASVCLDEGYMFGDLGAGFVRMNLACPQAQIREAVDRIKAAWQQFSPSR